MDICTHYPDLSVVSTPCDMLEEVRKSTGNPEEEHHPSLNATWSERIVSNNNLTHGQLLNATSPEQLVREG